VRPGERLALLLHDARAMRNDGGLSRLLCRQSRSIVTEQWSRTEIL